ncbi:neprilysin-like [Mercenaria mercenaria]|uniref:neprilysin-like n=1 Tax=Mercenaria mercenaria TaxID=6596 RepID=UPI00234E5C48|nr:neprilysin-like [Mercenaria mercenaria]XP_045161648.2 neprilysin-like [Mercenaria mercenaria]XP_053378993.1 neprilysin-like [Mercenaria mercenaria]XP_053378994.1 neprilysin-like [Mercenaria mercenaria]XP_053378995.1 neprilysin-like [Mercenaria mercenaria]
MSAVHSNKECDKGNIENGNSRLDLAKDTRVQLSFNKEGQGKGRTTRETGLIIFVFICLLAVIGLVIAVVLTKMDTEDAKPVDDTTTLPKGDTTPYTPEICLTHACVQASSRILQNMDLAVDPCEDFYMYSCGGWKKKTVIPQDRSQYRVVSELADTISIINKNLLEEDNTSYKNISAISKAKDMYASCIDLEEIEQEGSTAAIPLLSELGGWPVLGTNPGGNWSPNNFSLSQLLISLIQYNNKPLIHLHVFADVKDSEKYIIYMDQPEFGLPGRLYYLLDFLLPVREAYITLAVSVAKLFGADSDVADKEMREVLDLEIDIANISIRAEDRRDNEAVYNKMTISELKQNITEPGSTDTIQFDWLEYISGVFDLENVKIQVNESEPVVVEAIPYFEKLFSVLQKHGKRVVANYLVWFIIKHRASNLDSRFKDLITEYNKVLYGTASSSERWKECVSYTEAHFGMAVGHMFVKENFDESSKTTVHSMIGNIRNAFNELLDELDWMDETTKELAREKANAIKEWIGYPDKILIVEKLNKLYENATIKKHEYFQNILSNLKKHMSGQFRKLRQKYDKNDWTDAPSQVNALYNRVLNNIQFPAGILQSPFYNKDQPNSMNYGGIGTIIAHEITHGFDDQGRQFDKNGNLEQWWNTSIITNFKEKAQCFIDQYSRFVAPEANLTVNGINTQAENIADNGGVKQSFRAYRKWVEEGRQNIEEPMLPGLNFTHNQLFFISFAQIWCDNSRKEALVNLIKTGVHSPEQFRVIGTLQNFREFSDAFGCKKNSAMNPGDKCYVW